MMGKILVVVLMAFVMAKGRILHSVCLLNAEILICTLLWNIFMGVSAEETSKQSSILLEIELFKLPLEIPTVS